MINRSKINRRKTKFVLICAIQVIILAVLSACSQTSSRTEPQNVASNQNQNKQAEEPRATVKPPTSLVEKGKLTYGTEAAFPPFEFIKDGQIVGFNIELGEAIAEQMGLQAQIKNMTFDGLIPALKGNRIDIINSAMYITPQRLEQVDFVPYLRVTTSIVVKKGNPKGIKSMNDLSNKTVAVTRGAIDEIFVREQNEKLKQIGRPEIKILALPSGNDVVLAVQQGRADAMVHASPVAAYEIEQLPGVFEIATTLESNNQIGIAVRKGDVEMKTAIEAALKNLVANGTYEKLLEEYHYPAQMNYFNK